MEASLLKAFLIMVLRAFPYIILALVVVFLQDQLDRIQMILWTIGGSEFISGYFKYRHLEIIQPKMKEKGINVTI